jgi:hypothetical protein
MCGKEGLGEKRSSETVWLRVQMETGYKGLPALPTEQRDVNSPN